MAKTNTDPEMTQAASPAEDLPKDEPDVLRKKISSLYFGGDFTGCVKMIDENMRWLYEKERWPDIFFTVLRTYQRCFPYLNIQGSFGEHITERLKKSGVPFVFAALLRGSDESIVWNADYFKDLAVLSESGGDLETAISYCDLAVKLDPANATALVVRGWVLDDMGMPDEAAVMFERAVKLNESNHFARHSLAKHYADSNPSLALESIDKAIETAPSEGPYHETKAKIMLRLGDKEAAIACLDTAMACSTYNADYPYQKGEILLSQGKEMAAIAQYRKAMALNERHVPSLWRLAVLYRESQPELSLSYLNTIASLEPENREATLLRATLLGDLGKEAEAAEQFGSLIVDDPMFHEALAAYAALLIHSNPAEALSYYERAISASPKTANYHMGKARAYEELEQIPHAIKEYRQTVTLDAKNARAWARLAALLAETKPREAVGCYDKAIAIMPNNAFYHTCKGELLMGMQGGRREAAVCFESAINHDPKNSRLHALLGTLLEEGHDAPGALEHYKQAVNLGSVDPDIYYRLARLVLDSDPGLALLHINSAIRLAPADSEYYYFKSRVLNILGHDKNASAQLGEFLRAGGADTGALSELSELSGTEDPRSALTYINRAIEMSPNNPDYLCMRGNLFLSLDMPDKALTQYGEALKLNSKLPDALFGIGRCVASSDAQKALGFFNKALAINPADAACHAEKAALLQKLGKNAEALASLDTAISINGNNASYMDRAGELLETQNRESEAIVRYRKAIELDPACVHALGRLGFLLPKDASAEALAFLSRAIELNPQAYTYRIQAGKIHAAGGDMDAAVYEYKEAARLGGETSEIFYTLAEMLCADMPEAALGYCMRAMETRGHDADCHLLCGRIYLALRQKGEAMTQFEQAARLDPSRHEPLESIAGLLCENASPGALEAVDAALQNNSACPRCLFMKAKVLTEQTEDDRSAEAIECLDKVLKLESNYIAAREKLVELLAKNRSFLRLAIERRKLAKSR